MPVAFAMAAVARPLRTIYSEMKNGMAEINTGVTGLFESVKEVAAAGSINAVNIRSIKRLISHCKLK